MSSLRERQTKAIEQLLDVTSDERENLWKILIYDDMGRDIISPLFTVGELRSLGVTLYLHIDSKKSAIPDVPAVYLCQPTKENVKAIAKDVDNRLYGSYYLNFTRTIPTDVLAELATLTARSGKANLIEKVYDQFLSFIALEDDLFSLSLPGTYLTVHDSLTEENDMLKMADSIAEGLFSVFVTMNAVPVIASPRDNLADAVAQKLCTKLRDHVADFRKSMLEFDDIDLQASFHRPLLVLLDRDVDLAVMFHHPWTYEAQVKDYLNFHLNVITYAGKDENGKAAQNTFNIRKDDFFWRENRFSEFPVLAQSVERLLSTYQTDTKRIGQGVAVDESGIRDDVTSSDIKSSAKAMKSALESIPELQKTKALLGHHTNIAHAIMEQIKDRHLDVFHSIEEEIISKYPMGSTFPGGDKHLLNLIIDEAENEGKGGKSDAADEGRALRKSTPADKMRLFLIYFWLFKEIPNLESIERVLRDTGCDMRPYYYLQRVKKEMLMTLNGDSRDTNAPLKLLSTIFGTANRNFAAAEIVLSIMENKTNKTAEQYEIRDPKLKETIVGNSNRSSFNETFVFQIGAGSYSEFHNIQNAIKRINPKKSVIYGATEIYSSESFLQELAEGFDSTRRR